MHTSWLALPSQATLRRVIRRDLAGRDLLCWCAPRACHADLLLLFANAKCCETFQCKRAPCEIVPRPMMPHFYCSEHLELGLRLAALNLPGNFGPDD